MARKGVLEYVMFFIRPNFQEFQRPKKPKPNTGPSVLPRRTCFLKGLDDCDRGDAPPYRHCANSHHGIDRYVDVRSSHSGSITSQPLIATDSASFLGEGKKIYARRC